MCPAGNGDRNQMAGKVKSIELRGYEERADSLQRLGYKTYTEYLGSSLWKKIRSSVIERDERRCQICRGRGRQVHHTSYRFDVMAGKRLKSLHCVCRDCHLRVEFDGKRKRTFGEALSAFHKLLSFYGKIEQPKAREKEQSASPKKPVAAFVNPFELSRNVRWKVRKRIDEKRARLDGYHFRSYEEYFNSPERKNMIETIKIANQAADPTVATVNDKIRRRKDTEHVRKVSDLRQARIEAKRRRQDKYRPVSSQASRNVV